MKLTTSFTTGLHESTVSFKNRLTKCDEYGIPRIVQVVIYTPADMMYHCLTCSGDWICIPCEMIKDRELLDNSNEISELEYRTVEDMVAKLYKAFQKHLNSGV